MYYFSESANNPVGPQSCVPHFTVGETELLDSVTMPKRTQFLRGTAQRSVGLKVQASPSCWPGPRAIAKLGCHDAPSRPTDHWKRVESKVTPASPPPSVLPSSHFYYISFDGSSDLYKPSVLGIHLLERDRFSELAQMMGATGTPQLFSCRPHSAFVVFGYRG